MPRDLHVRRSTYATRAAWPWAAPAALLSDSASLAAGPASAGHQPPSDLEAVSYTHLTLPTICSV
eukprot:2479857-Rhodomonas_salina.1